MSEGRRNYSGIIKGPLPPGDGPNLRQFSLPGAPIQWIKKLGEGDQAFVYKVRIWSQDYALKVFKFSNPKDNRFYWRTGLKDELPMKKAIIYTDPFYAECRAYGRIQDGRFDKESKLPCIRQQVAVKCYGYLLLGRQDERWLISQGHDLRSDLIDSEVREALGGDTRVRAIVKHVHEGPKSLHAGNIRRAWANVRLLNNSLKIYNMDIKANNFIGFRLVDFGSSWTEPHAILQYLEDKEGGVPAKYVTGNDKRHFDDMIAKEQIPTRLKATHRPRYQLRSQGEAPWAGQALPERRRANTPRLG
ncbi:hypothetical protein GQX73_g1889 [Xylaria multiplex]|uniref:Protein kinase domain-containing protein n=1 Tax=Xylaria multiplex TaxID=323545 RepID=A0A7C8J627_9PEZI|nr:hypothetical protein GQX73_g1889 [Xylaria multiplex]